MDIIQIDESTRQIAQETTRDWNKGDEVVLAEIDGYGWKWIRTASM